MSNVVGHRTHGCFIKFLEAEQLSMSKLARRRSATAEEPPAIHGHESLGRFIVNHRLCESHPVCWRLTGPLTAANTCPHVCNHYTFTT